MEYPQDVQEIIEYTKLRKKYPELDNKLRSELGYGEILTMSQMYFLFSELKKHDKKNK
jgi:hypothetical protein